MSILLFFGVLFVLILVHEWGHFIVAKKTGMQVDEFGIGFPPKIFGFRKGETEYTFNLFPIGGFVKILGENGLPEEELADKSRSFNSKSKLAQAAVLIAGVTMNVLFAWILLVVIFVVGVPTSVTPDEASENAVLKVTNVLSEAPASKANIPPGAIIKDLKAGEVQLLNLTPEAFTNFVTEHQTTELALTYEYKEKEVSTKLTPQTGLIPDDQSRAILGLSVSLVENVKQSIPQALVSATVRTYELLVAITVGVVSLLANALILDADLTQVTGPVGIVGMVGEAASFGLTSLLLFTAVISLNLAVINMLPIPALDGGRLLFVALEAILRRPINPIWMSRVNLVGFVFLILLMVAVTYSDILKLL
jgi:regulator of sigma E protease